MKPRTGIPAIGTVALPIALLLTAAAARAGNGGSVYSRFGVGDLRTASSTQLIGLGGGGAAVRPAGGVNDLNPAAWSGISRVRFSASALYEGFSTDDGASSAYLAGIAFNGLALAVPLDSGLGLSFGAGLVPYSRVNYRVTGPVDQGGVVYTLSRTGEGGISRAFAGLAIRPFHGLSAGAQFEYFFGSNRYVLGQTFGSTYAGAELIRSENIGGAGVTIGLLYDRLGALLGMGEGRSLAVGAALTAASRPTVTSERVYRYDAAVSTNPNDTIDGGERTLRLPLALAAGISWSSGSLLAAADLRYQGWEGTTFETPGGVLLKNSLRVSAGIEVTRAAQQGTPPARRTSYSFGAYHDAGYLQIGGERIAENGVAAGISFPILAETRLSFAASFGMRGTTDGLLQEDKIFRISASMDIAEFWFQRPVEE